MPCTIKLVRTTASPAAFLDFAEYERLVTMAHEEGWRATLVILLGGDAGLRCGEIMALEWRHVDLDKRQIAVTQSEWKGHVTAPKSGKARSVPLTARLTEALRRGRHLRAGRVLVDESGQPFTQKVVQTIVRRNARRAQVDGGVHTLRHTFCSHLAMRLAPARAIQELAGHQDLTTTQRCMHLTPAALEAATGLLDGPRFGPSRGEIVDKTGLIRRIRAQLESPEPPESLKCSRAGTKQVQTGGPFAVFVRREGATRFSGGWGLPCQRLRRAYGARNALSTSANVIIIVMGSTGDAENPALS